MALWKLLTLHRRTDVVSVMKEFDKILRPEVHKERQKQNKINLAKLMALEMVVRDTLLGGRFYD